MKCYRVMGSVLLVSLVCAAGTVRADLVPNGSFTNDVSGWLCTGTVNWLGAGFAYSPPDGGCAALYDAQWLYQPGDTVPALVAGQTYQLSFLADLIAGPTGSIDVNVLTGPGGSTTAIDTWIPLTNTWTQYTATFTANADAVGHPFQPGFLGIAGSWIGIDNVSLSAVPAPEPSACVLLGIALFGLLAYAWRKRK